MLIISHREKNKNQEFDRFFEAKFNEHIIKHFHLESDNLNASVTITSSGIENLLSLHYHYHKQHFHLHFQGMNIYESASKLISELEDVIRKNKKNRLARVDRRDTRQVKTFLKAS